MADTKILNDISFRVVGNFLRVNQPYTAVDSPKPAPFSFDFPQIEVEQPATLGSLMNSVSKELSNVGFDFSFGNLPPSAPGKDQLLDVVKFGEQGQRPYEMNATAITQALAGVSEGPNGEPLVAAWQYYIFAKDSFGRDGRLEVSGRSPYGKSLVMRDGMRVIWRLLITHRGNTQVNALA